MSERALNRIKNVPNRIFGIAKKIRDYPGVWFRAAVDEAFAKGEISTEKAQFFHQQVDDPRAFQQIADIFHCTVTARILSYPISGFIGWYGVVNDRPDLVVYSLVTHIPIIPQISVTGVQRFVYLTARVGHDWITEKDKSKLPHPIKEIALLALAPIKPFGNASALGRANKDTAEVSLFATKTLAKHAGDFMKPVDPTPHFLPTVLRPTF